MTTPPMDADRMDAIRARCEKASHAPWVPLPSGSKKWVEIPATDEAIKANRDNDADFIAAARSDVPDLLAEVERLRAVIRGTHTTYCLPAWTDRGLHAPECLLYEIEDATPQDPRGEAGGEVGR